MMTRCVATALVCVAALAACSSGSGTGTGTSDVGATTGGAVDVPAQDLGSTGDSALAGETSTLPVECSVTVPCPGGKLCNCLGRCVPPGEPGLPKCTTDKNCGSDYFCDTCASVCRKLKGLCEACESTKECTDGGECLDFASGGRYCLKQCVSTVGCPKPGFSCEAVPGLGSKQCKPLSGKCVTPSLCTTDASCKVGEICNEGRCGPGCVEDTGCAVGTVCSAFRCVPACDDAKNPCASGQECKAGHCKIIGGCLEPKECEAQETYCDLTTHLCKPGCQTDFDCKKAGFGCESGKCIEKGCAGNFFCAFSEVCDLKSGKCDKAVGPYCEKDCDPQSETACGGKPNMCLKLQDKDGNDKGAFCFVGCGADPNNACPQGYACQEVKDDKGTVQGRICFRDCTYNPI